MSTINKILDAILNNIGVAISGLILGIFGLFYKKWMPVLVSAIESNIPQQTIIKTLCVSLLLNFLLLAIIWKFYLNRPALRLKYGILWDKDKNPHCPVCKNGGLNYNNWNYQLGYFCNCCEKVFSLVDSSGNDISPNKAIANL